MQCTTCSQGGLSGDIVQDRNTLLRGAMDHPPLGLQRWSGLASKVACA